MGSTRCRCLVHPDGVDTDGQWEALARAVQQRRAELNLRQHDLEERGGPSVGTVRNVEQGARSSYNLRTLTQLEVALRWPPGTVRKILNGQATDDDLSAVSVQQPLERQVDQYEAGVRADPRKSELALAAELIEVLMRTAPRHPDVENAIVSLQRALPHLSRVAPIPRSIEPVGGWGNQTPYADADTVAILLEQRADSQSGSGDEKDRRRRWLQAERAKSREE